MSVIEVDVPVTVVEIDPVSTVVELVLAPTFNFFWGPTPPANPHIGDLWLDTS